MKLHLPWVAQCRSGYEFNRKPCRRFCSRGELLCGDCATAEIIPQPESKLRAFLNTFGRRVEVSHA